MIKKTFRWLWALTLIAAFGIGCNLVTNVTQRVGGVEKTAQSVATGLQSGREIFSTGQALATNIQGNSMVQTVQAYVTQQAPGLEQTIQAFATDQGPGIQQTIQAFATDQGPGLEQTVQAFATQQGPGLEQTVQAFLTQDVPGLAETVQAVATQSGSTSGQAPKDIPLVEGDKTSLVTSQTFISYFTSLDFNSVVTFYDNQMPANGWTKLDKESIQNANNAVMIFDKPTRKATVTLGINPTNNTTVVVITVSQK
jgi:hypothetical protein